MSSNGFTLIELLVVIAIIGGASSLLPAIQSGGDGSARIEGERAMAALLAMEPESLPELRRRLAAPDPLATALASLDEDRDGRIDLEEVVRYDPGRLHPDLAGPLRRFLDAYRRSVDGLTVPERRSVSMPIPELALRSHAVINQRLQSLPDRGEGWTKAHDFRSGKPAQRDFDFEQRRRQALATGRTGDQPASESAALLEQLTRQYASKVEAENNRIQALARGADVPEPRPVVQNRGGDPADAVSSADPDYAAMHPCGKPEAALEVSGVQASPPLDPGEWVLVQGCGLGTSPGKVRVAGDFSGGYLDLEIKYWGSTQVSAQLPLVTGVGDMPAARLQLVRQDGKFSGLLDVGGFRATREVRRIHPTDVIVTCGSTFGSDDCTLGQSHPLSESEFFAGASFAAKHGVQTAPKDCDDSALYCLGQWWEKTDLASVQLANGWTLAGYAWWWNPLSGWNYVQSPAGFQTGSSSATIAMNWGLGLNAGQGPTKSDVRYRVDLYAVGPKGVPYK